MPEPNLLDIQDLAVSVDGKEILHEINLSVKPGETNVVFGPNGSGKTTLMMTIMGFPRYHITRGKIIFKGQDITQATLDERARLGIGMSFQRPPVVKGVKTRDMVTATLKARGREANVEALAEKTNMVNFLQRDINAGFSGGEIKRSELLQLLAQTPELVMLDEPESGVDLENIALIGDLINELLQKGCPVHQRTRGGLVITHTGHILEYVNAATGYVLFNGKIISCGASPLDILDNIKRKGYQECAICPMK
ncbi:MAG: ABC transporter ATP-binding protein [Dehalococcoidales bacterium]|jgi:Fe-S cluster assembly ATP-binding protein|nr:ABC transporter ATP-binding protein [Dehalococcoidales bacterium]MDX9986851.1 ABC transporter ATP-binding protein [Dehalococcoidales bacterium]